MAKKPTKPTSNSSVKPKPKAAGGQGKQRKKDK